MASHHHCIKFLQHNVSFSCYIFIFQGPTVVNFYCRLGYGKDRQKKTYQYKLKDSKFDELRKLGEFLVEDYKVAFKKAYGNLLGVLATREDA